MGVDITHMADLMESIAQMGFVEQSISARVKGLREAGLVA